MDFVSKVCKVRTEPYFASSENISHQFFFVNTKPIIQSGVAFGKNLPTVPVTHFGHLVYFQRQNGPNVLKKHVTSILGRFLSNFSYPVFSANKFISDTQCLHECWDVCRISVFSANKFSSDTQWLHG